MSDSESTPAPAASSPRPAEAQVSDHLQHADPLSVEPQIQQQQQQFFGESFSTGQRRSLSKADSGDSMFAFKGSSEDHSSSSESTSTVFDEQVGTQSILGKEIQNLSLADSGKKFLKAKRILGNPQPNPQHNNPEIPRTKFGQMMTSARSATTSPAGALALEAQKRELEETEELMEVDQSNAKGDGEVGRSGQSKKVKKEVDSKLPKEDKDDDEEDDD